MAEAQTAPGQLEALHIDRTAPALRQRRTGRWLLPLLLLLLAVAVAALLLLRRVPHVQVAEVRQALPGEQQTELSASGYVDSRRRSVIAPLVPGRLVAVLVEEGARVQEGQVLARLEDRDARATLARIQAEEVAARERLAAVQVQRANAERTLQRTRALVTQGVRPRAALDDARTAARALAAEARAASSQLAAARSAREAAALQLEHTVVRAPFSGTVARKLADVGAVLAPAALGEANLGGILELVDLGALEVEADVSEAELSRIRPGQPALIFLEAFPGRVFPAHTGSVRPSIDRSKATAQVKVLFDSPAGGVLPDMGARVAFLREEVPPGALDAQARSLRVPASALVRTEEGPVVWVVEQGRVRQQPVQPGPRVGEEVELARGPPAGTQVVVAPGPRLREGRRVQVQTEAS